jgi:alkanesulfonate monooxygenase SsuD/methylene tetrahydromethanopterin reductase-like flavin-dependent oxidoreductase (luciferase family)
VLIEDLTVAGDPADCVAKLRRLKDRGVDEVAILPFAPAGGDVRDMVELLLKEVAPSVAA